MKRILRGIEGEAKASSTRQSRFEQKTTRERVSTYRRAGRSQQAEAEKGFRDQQKLEERHVKWRQQMRNRHFQAEERDRKRIESRGLRESERAAVRSQRERERTASRITTGAGRTARGISGALKGAAVIGAGIAGVGAVNALGVQIDESRQASNLANQAGRPEVKGQLLNEARNVRGHTGGEALAGMSAFVGKTGELDEARALIGTLGDLAIATDSDLGDLGQTAGQVFNVLKDQISDPVERMKQLKSIMGTLAAQGMKGSVEIKDLAQDFGKLGAATRSFEGDAPALMRSMGAMAQLAVAAGGAESSADASTAAMRLGSDIVTNRKKFSNLGVDIKSKDDPTKLRDPMEIIADVLQKTGGDVEQTSGLFGQESAKIFRAFGAYFSEAEKKQKGSGKEALLAKHKEFADVELSDGQVQSAVGSRMADADMQLKENMKAFNEALGTQLLPTVTKLIPEFAKLIPPISTAVRIFAKFVEAFAENPLAGIGAIVAGAVVKDIITANIGGAIKGAITGEGGGGGAATMGLAGGVAIASAIFTVGVANFETRDANMDKGGALVKAAEMSTDVNVVKGLLAEQQKLVAGAQKEGVVESLTGSTILDEGAQGERATQAAFLERIEARMKVLEKLGPAADKLASAADAIAAAPAPNRYSPVTTGTYY
jgi:hypothetical protein